MKILVACEFSGIVRDAFIRRGHIAFSCDFLPSERPGPHLQCDVRDILNKDRWEMMIAFPPCNHLALSGARWFAEKKQQQLEALKFVRQLLDAPIQHISVENPVGVISTYIRKPDQIIQPYMFGENVSKATCLWLKNLPLLRATQMRYPIASYAHTQVRNQMDRSRTFYGIAEAMAEQWG